MLYICDTRDFFAAAIKENLKPTKENPNTEETCAHKVINVVNCWSNQMENLITAIKIVLLT